MELLSLPDEMCANVMKFLPFEKIQELRSISTRLDIISKQFRLNRFEVRTIYLPLDCLCPSLSDLKEKSAKLRESSERETDPSMKIFWEDLVRKDEQKQLREGIDYNMCRVSVVLKSRNVEANYEEDYEQCHWRTIVKPCADKREKYTVLDDLLSRLCFTDYLYVYSGEYNIELDKCFRRNRKLFKNARFASLRELTFNCTTEEFTWFKNYKNLEYVCYPLKNSNSDFAIEETMADNDAGIGFIQEHIGDTSNRGPHSFGDQLLQKWIERIPYKCKLRDYRHNFSVPLFCKFLLKFVSSATKVKEYHFGYFSPKAGASEKMRRFLNDNNITYREADNPRNTKFWIVFRDQESTVDFQIEK